MLLFHPSLGIRKLPTRTWGGRSSTAPGWPRLESHPSARSAFRLRDQAVYEYYAGYTSLGFIRTSIVFTCLTRDRSGGK
jgi:hypothetical protein